MPSHRTICLNAKQVRVIHAFYNSRNSLEIGTSLNMSQSALSRALFGAEESLGVSLFQRGWSGTEPTALGEIVIAQCLRVIENMEQVERSDLENPSDHLRLPVFTRWHHLQAVAAIVQTGSASAAAAALGIKQPAISQTLRALSFYVSPKLFTRGKSGLVPTDAAFSLAALWQRIESELSLIPTLLEQAAVGLVGRVSVGMLPFSGQDIVMKVFGDLTRDYPHLRLVGVPGSYNSLCEALRRREIDLVIGILRDPPPYVEFVETPLFDEHLTLIAHRDHPCHSENLTIEDLARLSWIVAPHGTPIRQYFELLFRDQGVVPPAQTCEILSFANAEQMIIDSDAIALLSYSSVQLKTLRPELRRVDLALPNTRIPIGLTRVGGEEPSQVIGVFLDQFRDRVSALGLT